MVELPPAASPPPSPVPNSNRLRSLLREEVFMVATPVIVAILLVLLAPLMVASLVKGLVTLFVLWVFGVGLSFFVKPEWSIRASHRVIFAVCSGVVYSILGWYYAANYEAPLTKADLAAAAFQSPSVVITSLDPIGPTDKDILRFNMAFVNQGQAGIRNPIPHFGVGYSAAPLKPVCEGAMFSGFDKFTQPAISSSDVLERNESRTSTLPGSLADKFGITLAKLSELQQKKMSLYLVIDIRFLDARTNSTWQRPSSIIWANQ